MNTINQKEYLKKYLGLGKKPGEKKNKKNKLKTVGDRLKIIDDDADTIFKEMQEDISAINEDTPQIVAIIDERPPSLRIDEKTNNKLWKPIGEFSESSNDQKIKLASSSNLKPLKKYKHKGCSDQSPPRTRIKREPSSDKDHTPPRREKEYSAIRKREKSEDFFPPRRKPTDCLLKIRRDENFFSRAKNRQRKNSQDYSPTRKPKRKKDDDISPRRKTCSTYRDNKDSVDMSPVRQKKKSKDNSPARRKCRGSSPNKVKNEKLSTLGASSKKLRWGKWSPERCSPRRTLDGRKAGLQHAKELGEEIAWMRQREEEMFSSLPSEVSGRNAITVARNMKKDDVDAEEEERKRRREKEMNEKYSRWGKGLKQVEDYKQCLADELHEMSKPLARYANDEDLETHLMEQERDGDPMLAYIRKKKQKKAVEASVPDKRTYKGEFKPNRFGIRPGFRWDGVDRSNGYETRWFKTQNAKKASQEEALKWSTEDM